MLTMLSRCLRMSPDRERLRDLWTEGKFSKRTRKTIADVLRVSDAHGSVFYLKYLNVSRERRLIPGMIASRGVFNRIE